ncbi:hypothetical protein AArcSl_3071 [Halalkaliarchaeum desulfuricum]|uniref:Uncharacterized protein n=1 Tax=Halalkaliarchaeum desulfuricum TaxID=2055893 RepID=A0A343TNK6_9EURY|nr:hypothetical protein [Halalkaliarchaeum desulfuricum]AUX10678.1 hypothetical protein AArcSl_3071 [Halalkaliarchaeum desulfuricum]
MDTSQLRERFIDTYSTSSEASVHDLVDQYESAQAYIAQNPDAGSYAVASALGAPRSRVRPWIEDDAMPDAYRGWNTVVTRGWHQLEGKTHLALTRLVAAVFAGGAISDPTYIPTWSFQNDREYDHLVTQLETVGVGSRRRDRGDGRGPTVEPRSNQSVFGRLLAARGAPVGSNLNELVIPEYLFKSEYVDGNEAFCETYLRLRGVDRPSKNIVQIYEQGRTDVFHGDLATLFTQIYGKESVRRHKKGIFVERDVFD